MALPLPVFVVPSFPPSLLCPGWVPVSCPILPTLLEATTIGSVTVTLSLSPLSPYQQKRAENLANREFHKKNIKEKAAHLASMFGHGDFPQVNTGLSEPPGTQMLHIWQSGHESISGASFPPPSSFSGRRGY